MRKSKAVIFGVGKNYKKSIGLLNEHFEIVGFIDNNKSVNDLLEGKECKLPKEINSFDFDVVVVTPNSYDEMKKQLLCLGVPEERIIIQAVEYAEWNTAKSIFGLKFYGQANEDLVIAAIFSHIGIEKPTYIDLGAHHPYHLSNTALMYENGCRGINIDASSASIELFKRYRPQDINLNVGVADKRGSLPFYMTDDIGARNTFVENAFNDEGYKVSYIKYLPVVTLDDIINEYCNSCFPDFLSCDIEGYDFQVLDSYDLKKTGPKVICVETSLDLNKKFDDMLDRKGYFRHSRIGGNNIYVKKEFRIPLVLP